MSEKRFEDDGECVCCSYDYSLLDTYYELKGERIIEWNKHSSNAEYFDFEGIVELLNIKQMRLESRKKYDKSLSETMLERDKVIKENNQLKEINKDKEQDVLHLYKKNEQLHQEKEKLIAKIDFLEKIIDGEL